MQEQSMEMETQQILTQILTPEIYKRIIKDLEDHKTKNQEVFQMQIEILKEKLKNKEEQLVTVRRQHGITSPVNFSQTSNQQSEEESFSDKNQIFREPNNRIITEQSNQSSSNLHQKTQFYAMLLEDNRTFEKQKQILEQENIKLKNQLDQNLKIKKLQAQEFRNTIDTLREQIIGQETRRIELEGNNKILMQQFIKINMYIESKETRVVQLQTQIEKLSKDYNKELDKTIIEYEERINKQIQKSLEKDKTLYDLKLEWEIKLSNQNQCNENRINQLGELYQTRLKSEKQRFEIELKSLNESNQKLEISIQNKEIEIREIREIFNMKLHQQQNKYKRKEQVTIQECSLKLSEQQQFHLRQQNLLKEEHQTQLLIKQNLIQQQKRTLQQFWNGKLMNLTQEYTNQQKRTEQTFRNHISKIQENATIKLDQLQSQWKNKLDIELTKNNEIVSNYIQVIGEKEHQIQKKQIQLNDLLINHNNTLNEVLALRKDKELIQEEIERYKQKIYLYEKSDEELRKEVKKLQASLHEEKLLAQQQQVEKQREMQLLSHQHQEDMAIKQREIEQLHSDFNQKSQVIVKKYAQLIRNITKDFRQELTELKNGLVQQIGETKEELLQMLISHEEERALYNNAPGKSSRFILNESSMSILNRQQMLEFQIEQLKKELIQMKSENYSLKFENRKYENKLLKQKEITSARHHHNNNYEKPQQQVTNNRSANKPETYHSSAYKNSSPLIEFGNKTVNIMPLLSVNSNILPGVAARNEKEFKKKKKEVDDHKAADQKLLSEILQMRKLIKESKLKTKMID